MTLIKREDAIKVVHKHFIDAFDDLPTATDEDGDVIYKDTKSVNELLRHNKAISKALKALPSADTVSREFYEDAVKANIGLVKENRELKEQIESAQAEKTYIGIDIPYGSDKGIATIFKGKDDKLILEEVKEIMAVVRCKD